MVPFSGLRKILNRTTTSINQKFQLTAWFKNLCNLIQLKFLATTSHRVYIEKLNEENSLERKAFTEFAQRKIHIVITLH